MSLPGVEGLMWSSPDADGVITCNCDVGAVSTLRGRRKRRGARQSRSDVQLWPASWCELLKDWLKQGSGDRRKWDALLKIVGGHRVHDAMNLLESLLKAGFIEVEEIKSSNQWKTLWVEFIDLEDMRELIGLSNRDKLQKQREGHSESIFQNNELQCLHETLANMPADRAIRRHDILIALDRWMADDNNGTRRDFALYARGDTKAITNSEWDWLENKLSLEDIGISRHTSSVWLRAPLLLTTDDGHLDLHAIPDCIGLTPNTIKSVIGISGEIKSWRILENRTVFERVARDRGHVDGVLWVPGFAPSWWKSSVAHILKLCPAPAFIACDPDPAGIEIAIDICDIWLANELEWTPWCMDSKSLSGLPKRKKLTEDDLSRLERLRMLSLPGILQDLIGWMMANGEKGEQEGISFNELCADSLSQGIEQYLKVLRIPLYDFPDVILHATETSVKKHPRYKEAKAGDSEAAFELVQATINDEQVEKLRILLNGRKPLLASAHAYEAEGVNAIPEVFADELAQRLDLVVDSGIIQTNVVAHTGANGFGRLARQPVFEGSVAPEQDYVLVDDFVGMGGTLANLRGYIEAQGGKVIGAVTLTGKPYSAKLSLDETQLQELREKHGTNLETWWQENFGHAFDCLTQSEARYLARSSDVDTIRDRIVAAKQKGDGGCV